MYVRTIGALITFMALNGAAAAQTAAPQPTGQPSDQPACALPAIADAIDLKQIPGSDLVTVPVEINGKPKQFLLAISSKASEVSQATVTELKLVEGFKRTETFQSGPADWPDDNSWRNQLTGATIQSTFVDVKGVHAEEDGRPHVLIPSFTMGNATAQNLVFAVAGDREMAKSAPYDGRMTGSFFRQYDVELDFTAMKLNYLTSTICTDPHQVVFWPHKEVAIIPMDTARGTIEVQVDIAGHKIMPCSIRLPHALSCDATLPRTRWASRRTARRCRPPAACATARTCRYTLPPFRKSHSRAASPLSTCRP